MAVDRRIQEFFDRIPVNAFLGFELVSCGDAGCALTMRGRDEFRQEGGVIQGGILAAFADTASAYAFVSSLAPEETMTGVEFKVNFLEPARLDGGALEATAKVVRRGRRLGVAKVTVTQANRPVATGLFTYLFGKRAS